MSRRRAASGRPVPVRSASVIAVALAATLMGAGPVTGAGGGARVVLRDVAFHRAVTRVHPGQRVTWSWEDPYVRHDLHAVGRLRFRGASARLTGSHAVRFTRSGTYRYVCSLHPGMRGSIVVR